MGTTTTEFDVCLQDTLDRDTIETEPNHRTFDLALYFKEADEQHRKDCSAICKDIETMLSAWLGKLQLKYLTAYLADDLPLELYKSKIGNITALFKTLAETSLERQAIYG